MERTATSSRLGAVRGSTPRLLAVLLALALAACGGASIAPSAIPSSGPHLEIPAALVDAIRADLEARIGVDVSSMVVGPYEKATWPDGSMGCPKPGEMYTQAIVEGYEVIVAYDGAEYDYRVSDSGIVRFCGLA